MKTVFVLLSMILTSVSAFAGGAVGTYSNGRPECELQVSISDFLGTGRDMLVAGVSQNKITPWGANFNVEMADLEKFGICMKSLTIDDSMGPGFGGYNSITLKLDDITCDVTAFTLANRGNDSIECPNMQKIK